MKIKLGEIKTVANKDRKFGSKTFYYAAYIEFENEVCPLLLTTDEIKVAIARAKVNKSDLPDFKRTFIQIIKDWFK